MASPSRVPSSQSRSRHRHRAPQHRILADRISQSMVDVVDRLAYVPGRALRLQYAFRDEPITELPCPVIGYHLLQQCASNAARMPISVTASRVCTGFRVTSPLSLTAAMRVIVTYGFTASARTRADPARPQQRRSTTNGCSHEGAGQPRRNPRSTRLEAPPDQRLGFESLRTLRPPDAQTPPGAQLHPQLQSRDT